MYEFLYISLLWLSSLFVDESIVPCRVFGHVYAIPGEVESSWVRYDRCPIKDEQIDRRIVLSSQKYCVLGVVPDEVKGNVPFWYTWGGASMHIGNNLYPIEIGEVIQKKKES